MHLRATRLAAVALATSVLKGAWTTHTGSGLGTKYSFEATPLVQNGVTYISTGNDEILTLDARTGQEIWEYRSGIDQSIIVTRP